MRLIIVLIACLLVTAEGQETALTFDTKEIELHPAISDKVAIARFQFENRGMDTVTITNLATSCGCTTASLEQKIYAPGQHGTIEAIFNIEDRSGPQKKSVIVTTSTPEANPINLTMNIMLPPIPVISPSVIVWDVGATAKERYISIHIPEQLPYTINGINVSNPHFVAEIIPGSDGRDYLIRLHPTSTAAPISATVDVITNFRNFHVFARVGD